MLAVNSFVGGAPSLGGVLIMAYMAAFAISLAPVVWLMISESVPLAMRSTSSARSAPATSNSRPAVGRPPNIWRKHR